MRSKAVSRLAVEGDFVVVFVLLILLPRDFATSNDVIVDADGDDCRHHSTDAAGDVAKTSSSTGNGARCGNASGGQPEASNAVLKEQHETRIRDRETWRFILLGRFWDFRHRPPTDVVHVSSSHDDDDHPGDRRGFEALAQIENNRSDRTCSESTTYIYSSQCVGARNLTGGRSDDVGLRLYFKVEPLDAVNRLRETKVASAFLYMKKKSALASASHRPALTNGRTGRQRTDGGPSGSTGRGSHQRRRPNRDADDFPSASLFSPSSHRSETTGAATSGLKIIVSSFSRSHKKNRQEMRSVSVIPFPRQSSEWIRMNLTPLVDEWMKRPLKNLGLQVTVRSDAPSSSSSSSSSDLNPDDFFEGINCSAATASNSSPIQLPQQWSLEEPVSQSIVNWTRIHLENITHPFLEVVTVEVPRSRPRHRRDARTESSSKRRIDGAEHDAEHYKSMVLCKWLKLLKNGENSSSRTRHQAPSTSNPVQPVAPLRHGGQESK